MRNILLGLALAALGLLAGSAVAAPPSDGAVRVISINTRNGTVSQRIVLSTNKAVVVQLDADARDVLVSSPDIVDAVVRNPRRIFLLALKTGQTNAFFFDAAGRQLASIDIRVEKDTTDLGTMLRNDMPDANIKVASMNDNVVLTGTVASAQESARAQDVAARFAGDPLKVVNMLRVAASEQVMLRVRISEMQRNIAKQFGVDIASAAIVAGVPMVGSSAPAFGLTGRALNDLTGGQIGQICNGATGSTVQNPLTVFQQGGSCSLQPNNLQGALQALEQVGLVHTLAEPNLTAVSGETAKFLAGGEFPVPVAKDNQGNVTVEFKQFGVGLSFTPVVLSAGRISLQVSTEVSELTNTGAFTLQGTTTAQGLTIPALSVRRAQTTVELPSGGSFAIAGLMQHNSKQVLQALPGVKDLPILGALFRSRDFQNDESELVIVITAYLVTPTAMANIALPTDGFLSPTDPETILLGRLNAVHDNKPAGTAKPNASSGVGFIIQ
ncbi:MAG: type II and III secretion system protein family protein [Rhizomicrobium sp.]